MAGRGPRCLRLNLHRLLLFILSLTCVLKLPKFYRTIFPDHVSVKESGESSEHIGRIIRYHHVILPQQLDNIVGTTAHVAVERIDGDRKRKPFLLIGAFGRFGNHMFNYASTYGIAVATNRTTLLSSDLHYSLKNMFRSISSRKKDLPQGMKTDVVLEQKAAGFAPDLFELPTFRDLTVCCFLQSWKYFSNVETDLRRQFVLHSYLVKSGQDLIKSLVKKQLKRISNFKNPPPTLIALNVTMVTAVATRNTIKPQEKVSEFTLIAVHVRRGDFADKFQIDRGYKPAPRSYFLKAMDYYRHHYSNCLFLVCGDDPEWAEHALSNTSSGIQAWDVQFLSEMSDGDFPMITLANHSIVSVGTFGWWGAWLSGGDVVYYNNWPKPFSEIGEQYVKEDHFPPHWIGIGD